MKVLIYEVKLTLLLYYTKYSGNNYGFFTAYSMEKNSEKQFEVNFKAFAGGIFRYIYFKVSQYELAQDLTGETFVKYWNVLRKGERVHNHKALLYFIARGLVIDHYRTKKNNKKQSIEKIDERLLSTVDTIEDKILQEQELQHVYTAIKKLKKEYQDILYLHFLEDLSVKEIALLQKKKENTIRVVVHRALKELKKKL